MSGEAKTPQPGEWWVDDETGCKCYFIGRTPKGEMVWQVEFDNNVEVGDIEWTGWHHAPWCTSWDSVEPKLPQEWFDLTSMDEHVLRTGIDNCRLSDSGWAVVSALTGVKVGEARKHGWREFRCRIEDAPKAAEPEPGRPHFPPNPRYEAVCCDCGKVMSEEERGQKRCELCSAYVTPVESPDDMVTQDRVPMRSGDQWRWSHWNKDAWERADVVPALKVYGEMRHGAKTSIGESRQSVMELRCRRKDLPPIAEPSPPLSTPEPPIEQEAEREVYLYWYDGNVVGRYADCPPQDPSFTQLVIRDGRVFIQAEETREVPR